MMDFLSNPVNERDVCSISKLERDDFSVSEVSQVYLEFVRQLDERDSCICVPFGAKTLLNQLMSEGKVKEDSFLRL